MCTHCQHPAACIAKGAGHCRQCNGLASLSKLHADPEFAKAHAGRMRKLNADPEFAKANAERMRKLHADPEFAKANAERMRKLNADPAFAKAHAERMRKLNADPAFAKANAERGAERMRKLHADHMRRLGIPAGKEDLYRLARRKGFTRKSAVQFARAQ